MLEFQKPIVRRGTYASIPVLIYLSKASWAQRLVMGWGFAWRAASRFIAGTEVEDAVRVIRELNGRAINVTLDHLGEHTSSGCRGLRMRHRRLSGH